jgi:hypothetical protein
MMKDKKYYYRSTHFSFDLMLSLIAFGTHNNSILTALHKKRQKKQEPSSKETKKKYPIYNSLARSPINNRISLLLTILTHTIIIFGPNSLLPLKRRLYSNGLINHRLVGNWSAYYRLVNHWLIYWLIYKLGFYYWLVSGLVYGVGWLHRVNWLLMHCRLGWLVLGLVYGVEGWFKGLL